MSFVEELKLLYPELSASELDKLASGDRDDDVSNFSTRKKFVENFRTSRASISSENSDEEEAFENFLEKMKTPAPVKSAPCSNRSMSDFIVDDDEVDSSEQSDSSMTYNLSLEQRRLKQCEETRIFFNRNNALTKNDSVESCSESDKENLVEETSSSHSPKFEKEKTPDCLIHFIPKNTPKSTACSGRMKIFTTPAASSSITKVKDKEFCIVENYLYNLSNKTTGTCFRKSRDKLIEELYCIFNKYAFDNKLPVSMKITWNVRMTQTAGYCYYSKNKAVEAERSARIELSDKVCDSAERVRDTLLHEMCHAIVWILHGSRESHGPLWKYWAKKAERTFPGLPKITTCHNYEVVAKFVYRCTLCSFEIHRHSKSLDTERKVCGKCRGKFELLRKGKRVKNELTTPAQPNKFALFVKANYGSVKKSGAKLSHKEIMSSLSSMFKQQLKFDDDDDDADGDNKQ